MNCIVDDSGYGAPMPWIGFYVTVSSLACLKFLCLDFLTGIINRKHWFSSQYLALNATSLTILANATKLLFDISTPMPGELDQLSKLSGTAFLCIYVGHFMPSIGGMEDSQLILNVVSLTLIVSTIIVNICIQMGTGVIHAFLPHHIITLAFMLIMLLITCSAALSISNMKQLFKQQYKLKWQQVSWEGSGSSHDEAAMATFTRLKNDVRKYWMMALSSNPQYALRRSYLGAAADIFCISEACVLIEALFRLNIGSVPLHRCILSSDYKQSILFILACQILAVLAGVTAPVYRTFTTGCLLSPGSKFNDDLIKESNGEIKVEKSWIQIFVEWKDQTIIGFKEFKKVRISCSKRFFVVFKVERYWIQSFVEWKDSEIPLPLNCELWELIYVRRFIHCTKNLTLEVGRHLQIFVVVLCTLVVHLVRLVLQLTFVSKFKVFMKQIITSMLTKVLTATRKAASLEESVVPLDTKRELRNFILHLEGEDRLVDWIFQTCYLSTKSARPKPLERLMDLLKVSIVSQDSTGLAPSCGDPVRSGGSGSQGPPDCWALPLVTLTGIAAAIPCTKEGHITSLLYGVSQGIEYVRLIDKKLGSDGMVNIRKAADIAWQGLRLYRRWLDVDLAALARKQKDVNKLIKHLAEKGNSYLVEFEKSMDSVQEDTKSGVDWSPRALAGISMHTISETILRDYSNLSNDELFECLRVLISDMLGACLTNLPRALSLDCFSFSFEAKAGYSVWKVASLLDETEKVLKALGNEGDHDLAINQCKYIDHWRSFMLNPSERQCIP